MTLVSSEWFVSKWTTSNQLLKGNCFVTSSNVQKVFIPVSNNLENNQTLLWNKSKQALLSHVTIRTLWKGNTPSVID